MRTPLLFKSLLCRLLFLLFFPLKCVNAPPSGQRGWEFDSRSNQLGFWILYSLFRTGLLPSFAFFFCIFQLLEIPKLFGNRLLRPFFFPKMSRETLDLFHDFIIARTAGLKEPRIDCHLDMWILQLGLDATWFIFASLV